MVLKLKTYHSFLFYGFLLNLFLCGSCQQDDDQYALPPITQSGENTFGCIINGRVMIPRDGTGTFNLEDNGLRVFGSPESLDYIEIRVNDFASKKTSGIVIHIEGLHNIGEYKVNESNCYQGVDSPSTTNIFCRVYDYKDKIYRSYCSYSSSGYISITKFENDQFIAGEFYCSLRNVDDSSDEIKITEGRFDLNLSTLRSANFP